MGLSIYYSGKFRKNASIAEMIEEVKEIAVLHKWKYTVFETSPPNQNDDPEKTDQSVYGITFSPPNCEPVMLSFLSDGRMVDPYLFEFYQHVKGEPVTDSICRCFTKTQYAGIEVHKLIIHLFRYLSDEYFEQFQLIDEGNYWETNDENVLEKNFNQYNQLMNTVAGALESGVINKGESIENYITRIMKEIGLRRKL